jgi:hypothetical protein
VTVPLDVTQAGHTSLRAQIYELTTGQNYDLDGARLPQVITNYVPPSATDLTTLGFPWGGPYSYNYPTDALPGSGPVGKVEETNAFFYWKYPSGITDQAGFTFTLKTSSGTVVPDTGSTIPLQSCSSVFTSNSAGAANPLSLGPGFEVQCLLIPNDSYTVSVTPNFNAPGPAIAPAPLTGTFTAPGVTMAWVPDIVGENGALAQANLASVGLTLGALSGGCTGYISQCTITSQQSTISAAPTGFNLTYADYSLLPLGTVVNASATKASSSACPVTCSNVTVTNEYGTAIDVYVYDRNAATLSTATTIDDNGMSTFDLSNVGDVYSIYPIDPSSTCGSDLGTSPTVGDIQGCATGANSYIAGNTGTANMVVT